MANISVTDHFAARLERSSFCHSEAEAKKREWKTETAAQNLINLFKEIKINQQSYSNKNTVPAPRFEAIFV